MKIDLKRGDSPGHFDVRYTYMFQMYLWHHTWKRGHHLTICKNLRWTSWQWQTSHRCPASGETLFSFLFVPLSVHVHYTFNVTIRNKSHFFSLSGHWRKVAIVIELLNNEQCDHGELWVNAPKVNKLQLHFWLIHWNCHHLRQWWINQNHKWSIVAQDRGIDAAPPSSWAARQMSTPLPH